MLIWYTDLDNASSVPGPLILVQQEGKYNHLYIRGALHHCPGVECGVRLSLGCAAELTDDEDNWLQQVTQINAFRKLPQMWGDFSQFQQHSHQQTTRGLN